MATVVAMAAAVAISDGERALGTWPGAAFQAPQRPAPTPRARHEASVAGRQPDLTPLCCCSLSPLQIQGIPCAGGGP